MKDKHQKFVYGWMADLARIKDGGLRGLFMACQLSMFTDSNQLEDTGSHISICSNARSFLSASGMQSCVRNFSLFSYDNSGRFIPQVDAGSQKLLDNAERYGLYIANHLEDYENGVLWAMDNIGLCDSVPIVHG